MDFLTKKKERGGYFYLSSSNSVPILDLMQPVVGMYRMPTPAFYGGSYTSAELMVSQHERCIVASHRGLLGRSTYGVCVLRCGLCRR